MASARLRGQAAAFLPLWVAMVIGSTLLFALPITSYLSDAGGLQLTIAGLDPRERDVQVHNVTQADAQQAHVFDEEIKARAANDLHGYLAIASLSVSSGFLDVTSRNGSRVPSADCCQTIQFVSHDQLAAHVVLTAGTLSGSGAGSAIPATLSEAAARNFNVTTGDRLCTSDRAKPDAICLVVTGIWRQRDPAEPFWAADSALASAVYVSQSDLFGSVKYSPAAYDLTAVLTPDMQAIRRADPGEVVDALAGLGPILGGNTAGWQVNQFLDGMVSSYRARSRAAAFVLQMLTAQIWLLALGAILFLAALRLSQDRLTIAVWRTRGWPRRLIATLLAGEIGALALLALVPGAATGTAVAWIVTARSYPNIAVPLAAVLRGVGPTVAAAWLVGAASLGVLVATASRSAVLSARAAATRPRPAWWQRPAVTAAAALLAGWALFEARTLGDARLREAGAGQPYDLLLPGVGIALAGVAAMPLVRLAGTLTLRVSGAVEVRLASIQLTRSPAAQQSLALLLAGTTALGVLAAAYSGTASRNAADRAAYAVGADLNAAARPAQPVDLDAIALPHAQSRTDVFRSYMRPGSSSTDIQALGVDPWSFARTAWTRPGLLPAGVDVLMNRLARAEPPTVMLPGKADALSVWIHGEHTGGRLVAHLTDAAGQPVIADFGALDFDGWKQLTASISPSAVVQPLRLRRLTFSPVSQAGTIAISQLAAVAGGTESSVIADFSSGAGVPQFSGPGPFASRSWWLSDGKTGSFLQTLLPDSRYPRNGQPTAHVYLDPSYLPVSLHAPTAGRGALGPGFFVAAESVPALVTPSILARQRVKVGDRLNFTIDHYSVTAIIVGTFDSFPTLYGDAVVFSLEPLLEVLGAYGYPHPWPGELWVKTASPDATAATLRADPTIDTVTEAGAVRRQKESDPLVLAGRVNLALGFLAALVLAVAAFGVHFLLVGRSRSSEYAVLEANGMDPSQVSRSIRIEQFLLIVVSLLIGAGIGAILSLVLLPALQVSASREDLIPPTVLGLDPVLLAAALIVVAAGSAAAGALGIRATRVRELMPELRALE